MLFFEKSSNYIHDLIRNGKMFKIKIGSTQTSTKSLSEDTIIFLYKKSN